MEGYFSYSLLDLLARFVSLQENNMHIKEERKENTTFFFFFSREMVQEIVLFPVSRHVFSHCNHEAGWVGWVFYQDN